MSVRTYLYLAPQNELLMDKTSAATSIEEKVTELALAVISYPDVTEEMIKSHADSIDALCSENGIARNMAARLLLQKLMKDSFVIPDEVKPRTRTIVDSLFYLMSSGLTKENVLDITAKHPKIIGYSKDNLEKRREYLSMNKEEFAALIAKCPQITCLSEDNLEKKLEYLSMNKEEFAALIAKHPQIAGYSEDNLEKRREYLKMNKEEFAALIAKNPQIAGYSEDNLRQKFDFYKDEFGVDKCTALGLDPQFFHIGCSLYGRILPRLYYTETLIGKPNAKDIKKYIHPKDEKFIAMLRRENPDANAETYSRFRECMAGIGKAMVKSKSV